MKLNVAGSKATGSAVAGSQQFSMAMNAKAFHTLSSTLYKDKFGAIIREICSNAYDAHLMVGTPERPFVLTFPDRIDSELVIRDFGPGISPDDISGVYCRFFESTKDQDNNTVGAFGLGSKTPFAYTDTFAVTSIHKGVKRIYTAFKDEGMPNLKLMAEMETDEESGLEVSIPVQGKDISSFHNAVIRELRFFPVKPVSNRQWDWADWEVAMDFGSVQFFKSQNAVMRGFFVQIGPVGYRIDKGMITEYAQNKGISLSPMTKHLLEMSVERGYYHPERHSAMLDMPIGTVEVQPSREGLHYTDETCQNILDAIGSAEQKVADEMVQRLDSAYATGCKTFFDTVNQMPQFLRGTLTNITDFKKNYEPFFVDPSGNLKVVWDTNIVSSCTLGKIDFGDERGSVVRTPLVWSEYDYKNNKTVRYGGIELFRADRVYIKDEAFAYKSRMHNHDNDSLVLYFIEPADGQSVDDLVAYFEKFFEVVRVSSLDKNVSRSRTSITGGKVRAWFDLGKWLDTNYVSQFSHKRSLYAHNVQSVFDANLNDITEPTVVLRTHNNSLVYDCDDVYNKLSLAAMLGDAGYKIIAIPKSVKYDNENLCEIEELTDDHHRILRDRLTEIQGAQALNVCIDFVCSFNASVRSMVDRKWLKGTVEDYGFDDEAFRKAQDSLPMMNPMRRHGDLEIVEAIVGSATKYQNMDELFEVANKMTGIDYVPSKMLEKIENEVSLQTIMMEYFNRNNYIVEAIFISKGYPMVDETFSIDFKPKILELVEK